MNHQTLAKYALLLFVTLSFDLLANEANENRIHSIFESLTKSNRTELISFAEALEKRQREAERKLELAFRKLESMGGTAKQLNSGDGGLQVTLPPIKRNNVTLTNEDLGVLRDLPEIAELRLASTRVSDTALQHILPLDKLRRLDLSHTQISRDGIEKLGRLKNLEHLNIEGTPSLGFSIPSLLKFPKLREVVLTSIPEEFNPSQEIADRLQGRDTAIYLGPNREQHSLGALVAKVSKNKTTHLTSLANHIEEPLRKTEATSSPFPKANTRSSLGTDEKVSVLQNFIQPIFEASCTECHGGEKQKAGLRLDTIEWILQGSSNGSVVTPGSSEDSSLYQRIALPESHDDRMPPKGAPLSKAQIELIKLWIDN